MDYYNKYLKYKNKYIKLKNIIGGSKLSSFNMEKSEIDTPNEVFSSYMDDCIPELNDETNEGYKSDKIRNVNWLKFNLKDNYYFINALKDSKNKTILETLPEDLQDKIKSDEWYTYFSFLEGFSNRERIYDISSLDTGTIINENNIIKIFKEKFISLDSFRNNISKNKGNYNSTTGKNFGNDNLYCALKELKTNKKNIKYIFLHAAGHEGLTKYYKNIGFDYNISLYIEMFRQTLGGIMFGDIDIILGKLEEKFNSNCDKKIITPLT